MRLKNLNRKIKIIIGASILIIFIGMFLFTTKTNGTDWVTTTVERGDVQDIVSISGFVESKNTAELSFPVTGVVTDIFVEEGSQVKKGNLLATLGSSKLVAQRSDALATLEKATAARDELISGPTTQARTVSKTTVASAKTNLANVITTESKKVKNARSILLSNELEVLAVDKFETATTPIISGAYTCVEEGTYNIFVYISGANSRFSYKITGLETGIGNANMEQPIPFGECGLFIQFTEGAHYANSKWTIDVPNTKSSTYITYKNAYELALEQETQNVQAAQNAVTLAQNQETFANATPSTEALRQVDASVYSAQAQIAQIDAQIKDLSIVAPFDGMVTNIDIRSGETAGATPVITLLEQKNFKLKARIPEIDITKIARGQKASIVFDAQSKETLYGELTFVSPLATEIDGVAYFETTIILDQVPKWIRAGLNADVDITVSLLKDMLRIPKRYLISNEDNTYSVLVLKKNTAVTVPVIPTSTGNNGYVAITGINEGDIIIAP